MPPQRTRAAGPGCPRRGQSRSRRDTARSARRRGPRCREHCRTHGRCRWRRGHPRLRGRQRDGDCRRRQGPGERHPGREGAEPDGEPPVRDVRPLGADGHDTGREECQAGRPDAVDPQHLGQQWRLPGERDPDRQQGRHRHGGLERRPTRHGLQVLQHEEKNPNAAKSCAVSERVPLPKPRSRNRLGSSSGALLRSPRRGHEGDAARERKRAARTEPEARRRFATSSAPGSSRWSPDGSVSPTRHCAPA